MKMHGMTIKRFLLPLMLLLICFGFVQAGYAAKPKWGPWETLQDTHSHGIDFAIKGPGKFDYGNGDRLWDYRFRNRYNQTVIFTIEVTAVVSGAEQYITGTFSAGAGEVLESSSMTMIASGFTDIRVVSLEFPSTQGGPSDAIATYLRLSGGKWSIKKSEMILKAAKISNESTLIQSGSLTWEVWATLSPFKGGELTGYGMGGSPGEPLPPGYFYNKPTVKVPYLKPPTGRFYTTMFLAENTGDGWLIHDYITDKKPKKF